MYAWLDDALGESAEVITANRRLARRLQADYAQRQMSAGRSAWATPAIRAWQDWLRQALANAHDQRALPTHINAEQSHWLWDRCLRQAIADPLINVPLLTRQSMEAWRRLQDWCVSLDDCGARANGRDRRLFARVAADYAGILQREHWVDDACIGALLEQQIQQQNVSVPDRLTVAGFDRLTPQQQRILNAMRDSGCDIDSVPVDDSPGSCEIRTFAAPDAELRAAGNWARERLSQDSSRRIGIVVSRLETDATRSVRLVREGFMPGWQDFSRSQQALVNVSYGQRLTDYPAIAIALLALRWPLQDLPGRDVAQLLRSPFVGAASAGGRARLELRLRDLPDRLWSPAMMLAELRGRDESDDARDWEQRVQSFSEHRHRLQDKAAPSDWAVRIDVLLKAVGWPGTAPLDSEEFQLINRWRDVLNNLARLDLVDGSIGYGDAIGRVATMAAEVVFQAEAEQPVLEVLGSLEAAGLQFDSLWIAGMTAQNWPPANRPLPLLSRELQREHGMPDAEPADTLDYARRVIDRLLQSAAETVCSYARSSGDAEQALTPLVPADRIDRMLDGSEPGWYASALSAASTAVVTVPDRVPPLRSNETLSGGAATIQRQLGEPFSAFAHGRLGVRSVPRILPGLSPRTRGILVHDALQRLYADLPGRSDIAAWSESEIDKRSGSAARQASYRLGLNADALLQSLLELERRRIASLLRAVIDVDRQRQAFQIDRVESLLDCDVGGVRLALRFDRADRDDEGRLQLIDYKTGTPKRFLNRDKQPVDYQLVVYARAIEEAVADLALFNIDARQTTIDGAGRNFTPKLDWDELMAAWFRDVELAIDEIVAGDVRIDALQSAADARPLNLLSRFQELTRDS